MAEWEPGQRWQWRKNGSSEWCDIGTDPVWDWLRDEYRRKPEPQLRAWKTEEVPIGALIRMKNSQHGRTVILFAFDGEIWDGTPTGYGREKYNTQRALELYEHSLDFGKTWHPCGVLAG